MINSQRCDTEKINLIEESKKNSHWLGYQAQSNDW